MSNQKYTKSDRLRKTHEYSSLSKHGARYFTTHFIIIFKNNNQIGSRLGVTVSKKIGNSVKRNRVKRIIREYFRLYIKNNSTSSDINVIARKSIGKLNSIDIFCSLRKIFGFIIDKSVIEKEIKQTNDS